jgi:hypothetical protein
MLFKKLKKLKTVKTYIRIFSFGFTKNIPVKSKFIIPILFINAFLVSYKEEINKKIKI